MQSAPTEMGNAPEISADKRSKLLPELFQLLTPHMAALDSFLLEQIESFEPEIREHVEYSVDTSGKRIRPSLIFFSGWNESNEVNHDLVRVAAVVEIIHLATLIHDDIMDEADVRRNRDTVAKKYGNATAVLLGDALFSHAVFLATQFPTTEVCQRVAESTRKVCTGEILQTMQRGDPEISLETYNRVIDLKTAELFSVACLLGAKLSGGSPEYVTAVAEFGRRLGIAYQIYDDLTDLYGTQQSIGKTLGTDIATGKATLPLIYLRDRLEDSEAQKLRDTLSGKIEADVPYWLAQLSKQGVFEDVRKAIFEEIELARAQVQPFAEKEAPNMLITISDLLWNQVEQLKSDQASN